MVSFPRIPFLSSRPRTTSHPTSTSPPNPSPRSATPNQPQPAVIPRYAAPNPAPTAPIPIPVSYAHKRRVSAPTRPQTAPIPAYTAASRAPRPLATKHASAAHTHATAHAELEPDDAWKQRLRRDIEESLRSMVAAAKQHVQAKLDAHPSARNAERRDVIANEHHAAMKTIRTLAEEQYRIALARERAERQWAAGQPIDEDWADALAQEQHAIMARIERERSVFGSGLGPSLNHTSYQSAGRARARSYSREPSRTRTGSNASQAVPVAGGSYGAHFPTTRTRTSSAASRVDPSTSASYRTWASARPRTASTSADKPTVHRPWTPNMPTERSASARPWTPGISAGSYRPWTPNTPAPGEQAQHNRSTHYGQLGSQSFQAASSAGSAGSAVSKSSHASSRPSSRGNRSASGSSSNDHSHSHSHSHSGGAPSSSPPSASSSHASASPLEPTNEWKTRLRTSIEASLAPMIATAKASFQAQLASTLAGAFAEEKEALVRDHRAAVHAIRALAEEQFREALERERSGRRGAVGDPIDESAREAQRAVGERIARERGMSGLGYTGAPHVAGPSGLTHEEKGRVRQRSASAAPAASYGASGSGARAGSSPSASATTPAADRVRADAHRRPPSPSPLRTSNLHAHARSASVAPVRMPTATRPAGAFEIWKPSITREEDALQSRPYSVARRAARV
ncbi:hypothetical protein CONPUDRAFT_146186 [Coniophora puteana RWD-64-598 SS2]|uniref:Uncharacterized protein n=1 Tax=Coniophora puteana (strain RWD-64-598) TaxID=741705 RepID=A0A5M3MCX4_CONPW|nr:uncharacterized protein CONPUDRAFT_146186 [Coniophora puteana RWD-64-598 SS2]EIW77102.1 hypothetical protein CONPUDRAFT_146186 [Coniophora puteana RWD-64-598 SS2]